MREIMDVPLPLAASRDLMSFFTFQISTFLSAASVESDIVYYLSFPAKLLINLKYKFYLNLRKAFLDDHTKLEIEWQ